MTRTFIGKIVLVAALLSVAGWGNAVAQTYSPPIAPASEEAQRAIGNFVVPEDMRVEVVAAEPMLANPVCFYIDHDGRIFVAETFRHHHGVTDMREHTEWLVDDLKSRTVEDRLVAMKANLGNEFPSYAEAHDRVRLIEDTDGDGIADKATVFADGFRDALAGIGAGLLVDRGEVFYTCIPELWKLVDNTGDGRVDERVVMSSGYGVHINFLGHDLHGLRKGPDGRLYFSIGDRGLHVKTQEGTLIDEPDTGAVLRCWPDGSGLEVVHRGLRNPQELAFDNYGNLFTGDNNSDAGDQARWVWVVEGGDSGWHIGWQWITEPNVRGPWNAEKMWHPYHDGQPAHIVPPLANIGAGPSGLAFYPGTGLPERYKDHFFLCDFRGDAGRSLIHAFRVEPKGAYFEVVGRHDFASRMLCTDVDFGVDGGIYWSDWVQGWDQPLKGRMYRLYAPSLEDDPVIAQTKQLLSEGFAHRSQDELVELLKHPDQRVRLEAQYALADQEQNSLHRLERLAKESGHQLQRIHAMWAIWQMGLHGITDMTALLPLLQDDDTEIRAQAAKILGDSRAESVPPALMKAIDDESYRVRFFAAISFGKAPETHDLMAVTYFSELLRENDNRDPYLRHAAVMGLVGRADEAMLQRLSRDISSSVRLGALLALRRMESERVAHFLNDADPFLVTEAARAINDVPIPEAFPALAKFSEEDVDAFDANTPLMRRVLNVNARLRGEDAAERLGAIAMGGDIPIPFRVEALQHLETWAEEVPLDKVTGLWRPVVAGKSETVRVALRGKVKGLLQDGKAEIRVAAANIAGKHGIENASPVLLGLVKNDDDMRVQVAALQALAALDARELTEAIAIARESRLSTVRVEALRRLAKLNPEEAVPILADAVETSHSVNERQLAFAALGELRHPEAEKALSKWIERLAAGRVDESLQLDVLEAARGMDSTALEGKISDYLSALPETDPLAPYRPALFGGDRREGQDIFFQKTEVSCVRCHAVDGQGGREEVGPDLSGIGGRVTREHILEAIVAPNARIAEGFENVTLYMKNGAEHMGRVIEEDEDTIVLEIAEDPYVVDWWDDSGKPHSEVDAVAEGKPAEQPVKRVTIKKRDIDERVRNLSSMPDNFDELLTPFEIRHLVEYLATRR